MKQFLEKLILCLFLVPLTLPVYSAFGTEESKNSEKPEECVHLLLSKETKEHLRVIEQMFVMRQGLENVVDWCGSMKSFHALHSRTYRTKHSPLDKERNSLPLSFEDTKRILTELNTQGYIKYDSEKQILPPLFVSLENLATSDIHTQVALALYSHLSSYDGMSLDQFDKNRVVNQGLTQVKRLLRRNSEVKMSIFLNIYTEEQFKAVGDLANTIIELNNYFNFVAVIDRQMLVQMDQNYFKIYGSPIALPQRIGVYSIGSSVIDKRDASLMYFREKFSL